MTGAIGGDGRKAARDSLFLMTVLRDEQGSELGRAKIRNLSHTGMLAETGLPLVKGQKLRFDLRGIGVVTGEVVRGEEGRFGIRFEGRIDPRLARKPVTSGDHYSGHPPAYRF